MDKLPELKVGDRVELTLRGEVARLSARSIGLQLDGAPDGYAQVFIHTELAQAHIRVLPRPIAVGDVVRGRTINGLGFTGKVLAIHSDFAWLADSNDCGVLARLFTCKRVEAGPPKGDPTKPEPPEGQPVSIRWAESEDEAERDPYDPARRR